VEQRKENALSGAQKAALAEVAVVVALQIIPIGGLVEVTAAMEKMDTMVVTHLMAEQVKELQRENLEKTVANCTAVVAAGDDIFMEQRR
jgi:hypothetical protein